MNGGQPQSEDPIMAATQESAPAPGEGQAVAAGIGLMVLSIFLFAVNDVLGKWLAGTYSAGQILLFRSIVATLVLAPLVVRAGPATIVKVQRPGLQVLRVVFSTAEVACFYIAVSVLPLANAMTYYLASPIFVTLLAALLLREKVGWRRWTAVIVGFGGVVIALQPSSITFGWPPLVALLGSVAFAFLMIVTRSLRGTPDLTMVVWQVGAALLFGLVAAPFDWVPIAGYDALLMGALGFVAIIAIVCLNRSLKLAPASVVVPYQYSIIVWAVVFGYAVFGDVPNLATLAGAAIIIGAGLFIFFREQKVAKRAVPEVMPGPE
jgi:drug/metabolite transporter (DMT)-like permease